MRDYAYRYSVSMITVAGHNSPAGWPTTNRAGDRRPKRLLGKPNDEKLACYVFDYNASLLEGGVNAHIGPNGRCTSAEVLDHNTGEVVARWRPAETAAARLAFGGGSAHSL